MFGHAFLGARYFAPPYFGPAVTALALSQAPVEVVWQETTPVDLVVSQDPLEVVWQETTPIALIVSQAALEVLWSPSLVPAEVPITTGTTVTAVGAARADTHVAITTGTTVAAVGTALLGPVRVTAADAEVFASPPADTHATATFGEVFGGPPATADVTAVEGEVFAGPP